MSFSGLVLPLISGADRIGKTATAYGPIREDGLGITEIGEKESKEACCFEADYEK